jgi:hypothetical protein
MKKILHAKHWQLFILIFVCGAWVSPEPWQTMVNGIAFATLFWWMYAIAVYGQQKIIAYGLKPMNLNLFKINFFFIVIAVIAGFLFPALLAPVALLAWQRGLPPGERATLCATIGGRVALLRRKR